MIKRTTKKLSEQVAEKQAEDLARVNNSQEYDGSETVISTGSTLLDLAISGGRFPQGGIPTGILVEIFGPSGAGKTVMLSQIAGNVQQAGGKVMFHDPEARLNQQFARMFGLEMDGVDYTTPDTIPEVFSAVRNWGNGTDTPIKGVFADSLAALSTDLEMDSKEGDKMGMRRAKEFSEELRRTCRIITKENILMVCSNQVRQNIDAGLYGQKYISPGGQSIGFYSSLRLRCNTPQKIKIKKSVKGVEHERIVGTKVSIEVFKSSVWQPYRTADVYILFDYGIDDIRANLQYLKDTHKQTTYVLGERKLDRSMTKSIQIIEEEGLVEELKNEVIETWNAIENEFTEQRIPRIKTAQ